MKDDPKPKTFAEAGDEPPISLGRELIEMLTHNKKWWLLPILLVLFLFGLLLFLILIRFQNETKHPRPGANTPHAFTV